ncbi:hypothetical protein SF83666_b58200 (plasmid) [Sinorhizobium fredii CCBAU 83666]|nr:hypothetical protein SF83666_b58200 [Sinorhizobium fredii CCBAU 83666]
MRAILRMVDRDLLSVSIELSAADAALSRAAAIVRALRA